LCWQAFEVRWADGQKECNEYANRQSSPVLDTTDGKAPSISLTGTGADAMLAAASGNKSAIVAELRCIVEIPGRLTIQASSVCPLLIIVVLYRPPAQLGIPRLRSKIANGSHANISRRQTARLVNCPTA
jgi:hypothetical protein